MGSYLPKDLQKASSRSCLQPSPKLEPCSSGMLCETRKMGHTKAWELHLKICCPPKEHLLCLCLVQWTLEASAAIIHRAKISLWHQEKCLQWQRSTLAERVFPKPLVFCSCSNKTQNYSLKAVNRTALFDSLPIPRLAAQFKYLWPWKSTFWSDAVHFTSAFHIPYSLGMLAGSLEVFTSSQCRGGQILHKQNNFQRWEMCYHLGQQISHSPYLLSMKQAPPASINLPHNWSRAAPHH